MTTPAARRPSPIAHRPLLRRRRELVRRELRAWHQLVDVEAAVELRRVDVAVPVVRAPGSADRVTCAIVRVCRVAWRVDRTAIEECDLRRMVGVGEVHDVDATLIPAPVSYTHLRAHET